MNARKWFRILFATVILVALLIPVATFANDGPPVGPPIVDVTLDIVTVDSKVGGGYWAYDYILRHIQIWEIDEGEFLAIVTDTGIFESWAGDSPNATGTIGDGVTGTIAGGYSVTFNGDFDPEVATMGYLGYFDYGCDQEADCPDYVDWRNFFFDEQWNWTYLSWGWTYTTCGNGYWINADSGSGGNEGDITGEPVACPAPPMRLVVKGLYAFINPVLDRNICYILSFGRPGPDDLERLCFTKISPNWWEGATLLTNGDVYDNGTDWGFWEGDAVASAYSGAKRLPLYAEGPNNDLREKAHMFPWTQQ